MLVTRRIRAESERERKGRSAGVNEGWFNFTTLCRSIRSRSTHIFHRVPWSEMAEATSESINSLSSRLARNTFHPFLHRSVVYVGRPQFDAPPPPPPLYIFPPSCRAHVGREHVAKEVCAVRSARVLDNDGAQHIANHAWRAQQSGLKVVQIRDDDRPGNYQHLRLAIYRKRIYIYIYIPSLPLVSFCSGAGLYSVLS